MAPGPGVISAGHWCEPNGTAGGRNGFFPRRSISEMQRRGKQPFLPPAVPFGSKQWPTLITPGPGPTSLDDLK